MKTYIANFFIWWYAIKLFDYLYLVRFVFIWLMIRTRALPMLKYINKPLYGDDSFWGKLIGPIIRFFWGIGGLIISIFFSLPFIILVPVVILLPLAPLLQVIIFLI
ncbi:hypothetical protein KC669_02760 [Candidatus Dojkabacteria bacterium]|uniref:Uncharacterized protein n=1 Tax=Candidatus Dojkabacteria bacterium TaxID=2099670 RepID=A0A955LA36_9BACT|nr:hypothetical protein [Candidatus Dojkabacteria bacterium]